MRQPERDMPQPKSRKIAILGYRSVGEFRADAVQVNRGRYLMGLGCNTGTDHQAFHVYASFNRLKYREQILFSPGETWTSWVLAHEAAHNALKLDHFTANWRVSSQGPEPWLVNYIFHVKAWRNVAHYYRFIWPCVKGKKRTWFALKVC